MIEFEPPGLVSRDVRRAVFVDRDGVLIANRDDDYVRGAADIEILPNAARAVRLMTSTGFLVVVISNQAGVAKGLMTAQAARSVHEEVVRRFRDLGAELFASYLCPHAPVDCCSCRKPQPGMIRRASRRLNIDLSRSFLVGDALSDVAAGEAAGLRSHLVLTGRGSRQARLAEAARLRPEQVHQDLLAAADAIALLTHLDGD